MLKKKIAKAEAIINSPIIYIICLDNIFFIFQNRYRKILQIQFLWV